MRPTRAVPYSLLVNILGTGESVLGCEPEDVLAAYQKKAAAIGYEKLPSTAGKHTSQNGVNPKFLMERAGLTVYRGPVVADKWRIVWGHYGPSWAVAVYKTWACRQRAVWFNVDDFTRILDDLKARPAEQQQAEAVYTLAGKDGMLRWLEHRYLCRKVRSKR